MTNATYLTIHFAASKHRALYQGPRPSQGMGHPSELAAAGIVFVVAAVAVAITVVAARAAQHKESRSLRFVTFAFGLFATKQVIVGIALLTEFIEHQHLEVAAAVFDLGIVVLLIWPIIR